MQYCLNLSAPFIVEVPPFKKVLTDLIPYVDFLVRPSAVMRSAACCCFAPCGVAG